MCLMVGALRWGGGYRMWIHIPRICIIAGWKSNYRMDNSITYWACYFFANTAGA